MWTKVRDNKNVLGDLVKDVLDVAEQAMSIREQELRKMAKKNRGQV